MTSGFHFLSLCVRVLTSPMLHSGCGNFSSISRFELNKPKYLGDSMINFISLSSALNPFISSLSIPNILFVAFFSILNFQIPRCPFTFLMGSFSLMKSITGHAYPVAVFSGLPNTTHPTIQPCRFSLSTSSRVLSYSSSDTFTFSFSTIAPAWM